LIKLIFSYDYELAWGVWDTLPERYLNENISEANRCAEKIMHAHISFGIKATWAVVGAAIDRNIDWEKIRRVLINNTTSESGLRNFEKLIEKSDFNQIPNKNLQTIKDSDLFEFASHTYWHRYVNNCTTADLHNDFELFEKAASDKAVRSIVFPRNIVSLESISLASKYNYGCVRVNPNNWLYQTVKKDDMQGKFIKFVRYVDAFFPLQEFLPMRKNSISDQSMLSVGQYFFRAHCGGKFRNWLHIKRLILGYRICRMKNVDFHIWSHPHNFGGNPTMAMENLEILLKYFQKQISSGDLISKNMCDIL